MSDSSLYNVLTAKWHAPSRVAVLVPNAAPMTFADLADRAGAFANVLVANAGLPGDRLIAQVSKSTDALCLYLGCLRAGMIFIPLNTAYTPAEVADFIADAEPTIFVCDAGCEADVRGITAARCVTVLSLAADGIDPPGSLQVQAQSAAHAFATVTADAESPAAILYTSGTTGRAKGAMLSHRNLIANAEALSTCWQMTAEDCLLHALPIFHTHGLFVAANVTFSVGAEMIFLPKFDVATVVDQLPQATVFMGVPTFYTRLLAEPTFNAEATRRIRLLTSGSAPLLAATHAAVTKRTGHAIVERYGLTETGIITSNPFDGARRPGTVGPALAGVELRIAPTDTRLASDGAPLAGAIEVRGANVFGGYWRNLEKSAEAFTADGFFKTGDVGIISDDGYVEITGREKDLIISGGFNVTPRDVERALLDFPEIAACAVIGVPHADFGEAVVAVVTAAGGATPDEARICQALAGKIANFKIPKRIVVVDRLPENAMGKILKTELREAYRTLLE